LEVNDHVVPYLKRFIEIPNLSRSFDENWNTNGLMEQAAHLCLEYAKARDVKGLTCEVSKDEGKTLFLLGEVEATKPKEEAKTILIYGHIDKQPHMTEAWREGLHPTKAIQEGDLLYGRGSHDDGYAWFLAVSLVKALQIQNIPHDKYILFFESDEETESADLFYYLDKFSDRIGQPDLTICLDSGSLSDKMLAITSTLRGILTLKMTVQTMPESIHSGNSGIVPSTFRIARQLLDRIEDKTTGEMFEPLRVEIPEDKLRQATFTSQLMGMTQKEGSAPFPVIEGLQLVGENLLQNYLNTIWRPQLEITGCEGIPDMNGGNVLRNKTTLKLSIRLPPKVDPHQAYEAVKSTLESNPPYNAKVSVTSMEEPSPGWNAPTYPEEFQRILDEAANEVFGMDSVGTGIGGSIPFVELLSQRFTKSLFLVTGVGLPNSNAHGPNESIDVRYLNNFGQALGLIASKY